MNHTYTQQQNTSSTPRRPDTGANPMATLCGAKARSTGQPCQQPVTPGGTRCRFHGGAAPQAKAKAHLRLVEAELMRKLGKEIPITPVDNPLAAYAKFAGRVMAWFDLLDQVTDDLRRATSEDAFGGEHVKAEIELFERAMDRANTVLSSYARLNIDERLAKLSKVQSDAVVRAIDAVILFLGASAQQAGEARSVAAGHLRAVS